MFDENSIISINGKMLQSKMLYDESRDLLSKIDSLLDEYFVVKLSLKLKKFPPKSDARNRLEAGILYLYIVPQAVLSNRLSGAAT